MMIYVYMYVCMYVCSYMQVWSSFFPSLLIPISFPNKGTYKHHNVGRWIHHHSVYLPTYLPTYLPCPLSPAIKYVRMDV